MNNYAQRRSDNNDGMDPDWKPNLNFTDDNLSKAKALSNELGINDLLKLRDHVESKIKEIYGICRSTSET